MKKQLLSEIRKFQKIAGILKESPINSQNIKWSYPEVDTDSEDFYYEYNPESEDYSISTAVYGIGIDGKKYKGLYLTNVPSLDDLDDLVVDPSAIEDIEQVESMNEWHSDDPSSTEIDNTKEDSLTAEEVKKILSKKLTSEEMKESRIRDTTYGYVEFRYGYWEGHIPQNVANTLDAHFNVKQNSIDTDEGRLFYFELRPK